MTAEVKPRAHMQGGLAVTENDCMSHCTQLFSGGVQEVSMVNRYQLQHRPLHKTAPWVYTLPNVGNSYIDLPATRVFFSFKITKNNGDPIVLTDNVAVINMMGAALISRVDIQIGGRTIPDLQTMHHNYKAYVELLTSYGLTAAQSQLRCVGWRCDDPGQYEDFKPHVPEIPEIRQVVGVAADRDRGIAAVAAVAPRARVPGSDSSNSGYRDRRNHSALSRVMQTCWGLHSDFFLMGTLFPPDTSLTVTLHRASDDFLLCTGGNDKYKVEVIDTYMEVHYINLAPGMHESNMARLLKEPMCVPCNVTEVRTHPIGVGPTNIRWDITTGGILPKKVIIFLVDSEGFNGSQKKNPFLFSPRNLEYLQLKVNSWNYPDEPYTPDFSQSHCMREYRALFDNIGFQNDDAGNSVTYQQFLNGMTIFPFDFTPDRCNGFHNHGPKLTGSVSLDARFKEEVRNLTIVSIVYYDGKFMMDNCLNVWVDRG